MINQLMDIINVIGVICSTAVLTQAKSKASIIFWSILLMVNFFDVLASIFHWF